MSITFSTSPHTVAASWPSLTTSSHYKVTYQKSTDISETTFENYSLSNSVLIGGLTTGDVVTVRVYTVTSNMPTLTYSGSATVPANSLANVQKASLYRDGNYAIEYLKSITGSTEVEGAKSVLASGDPVEIVATVDNEDKKLEAFLVKSGTSFTYGRNDKLYVAAEGADTITINGVASHTISSVTTSSLTLDNTVYTVGNTYTLDGRYVKVVQTV
jgi:hypothetical protein